MVVELISVGTELLLGNIVNTNAQYLAEKCAASGAYLCIISLSLEIIQPDWQIPSRRRLDRSDVVILTGGLGPTEDDLTKEVCAEVMGFATG